MKTPRRTPPRPTPRLEFIMLSSRAGRARQFSIAKRTIYMIFTAALLLITITGLSIGFNILSFNRINALEVLEKENEGLRTESNILGMRLRKVQASLQEVEDLALRLRSLATGIEMPSEKLNKGAQIHPGQSQERAQNIPPPQSIDTLQNMQLSAIGPLPLEEHLLGSLVMSWENLSGSKKKILGRVHAEKLAFQTTFSLLEHVTDASAEQARKLQEILEDLKQYQERIALTPTLAPCYGTLTSLFGNRVGPFSGSIQKHQGLDISAPTGTEIRAAARGEVLVATWADDYGYHVDLKHGFGLSTRYGHMSKILVEQGQIVEKGTIIGLVGNTGRSTGPHLHYEVARQGQRIDPLDFIHTW